MKKAKTRAIPTLAMMLAIIMTISGIPLAAFAEEEAASGEAVQGIIEPAEARNGEQPPVVELQEITLDSKVPEPEQTPSDGNGNQLQKDPPVVSEIAVGDVADSDTVSFNGHQYKLFDEELSWDEARDYCESIGGRLATITTEEEQDFIQTLLQSGVREQYYLGGSKTDTWEWITGEQWNYTNWAEGEPSLEPDELYLSIVKTFLPTGTWNNTFGESSIIRSGFSRGFICEWGDIGDSDGTPDTYFSAKSITPANGTTDVSIAGGGAVIDFGGGYIGDEHQVLLRRYSDDALVECEYQTWEYKLYLDAKKPLDPKTRYYLDIKPGAFTQSGSGALFAGLGKEDYSYTTAGAPPVLVSATPGKGSKRISLKKGNEITLQFSRSLDEYYNSRNDAVIELHWEPVEGFGSNHKESKTNYSVVWSTDKSGGTEIKLQLKEGLYAYENYFITISPGTKKATDDSTFSGWTIQSSMNNNAYNFRTEPDNISLSGSVTQLNVYESRKLSATTQVVVMLKTAIAIPYMQTSTLGDEMAIQWNSSNSAVASVDAAGIVTGVSAGKTTISALVNTVSGETLSAKFELKVNMPDKAMLTRYVNFPDGLKLHSEPSTSSTFEVNIPFRAQLQGEYFLPSGRPTTGTNWVSVKYGNQTGYVRAEYLSETSPNTNLNDLLGTRSSYINNIGYGTSGKVSVPYYTAFEAAQCTWYAAGRFYETYGVPLQFKAITGLHAGSWAGYDGMCAGLTYEINVNGVTTHKTLKWIEFYTAKKQGFIPAKSILVMTGGQGHAIFVEGVQDGNVYFSEANANFFQGSVSADKKTQKPAKVRNIFDNSDGVIVSTDWNNFGNQNQFTLAGFLYFDDDINEN